MDNIPYDGSQTGGFPLPDQDNAEPTPLEQKLYDIKVDNKWDLLKQWTEKEKQRLWAELSSFNYGTDDLRKVGERTVTYNAISNAFDNLIQWVEQNAKQVEESKRTKRVRKGS